MYCVLLYYLRNGNGTARRHGALLTFCGANEPQLLYIYDIYINKYKIYKIVIIKYVYYKNVIYIYIYIYIYNIFQYIFYIWSLSFSLALSLSLSIYINIYRCSLVANNMFDNIFMFDDMIVFTNNLRRRGGALCGAGTRSRVPLLVATVPR